MKSPAEIHAKVEEKKKPHLLPHYLIGVGLAILFAFFANGAHL
jgi:hypothetical protein